jgi:hypothetical protein
MAGMGFSELVLPGSSLFKPFGCCSGGFNFGHFTSPCPKKGLAVTNYKKKRQRCIRQNAVHTLIHFTMD